LLEFYCFLREAYNNQKNSPKITRYKENKIIKPFSVASDIRISVSAEKTAALLSAAAL